MAKSEHAKASWWYQRIALQPIFIRLFLIFKACPIAGGVVGLYCITDLQLRRIDSPGDDLSSFGNQG
jgi:hypothetical protein